MDKDQGKVFGKSVEKGATLVQWGVTKWLDAIKVQCSLYEDDAINAVNAMWAEHGSGVSTSVIFENQTTRTLEIRYSKDFSGILGKYPYPSRVEPGQIAVWLHVKSSALSLRGSDGGVAYWISGTDDYVIFRWISPWGGDNKLAGVISDGYIFTGEYPPIVDTSVLMLQKDRFHLDLSIGQSDESIMKVIFREDPPVPITDLFLYFTENPLGGPTANYIKVSGNLNSNTPKGSAIYLYYSTDVTKGKPITSIECTHNTEERLAKIKPKEEFQPVSNNLKDNLGDLNKGIPSPAEYMYMWYTKNEQAGKPIVDLIIASSPSKSTLKCPDGFEMCDVNLNLGAGGDYVYLCYRRQES